MKEPDRKNSFFVDVQVIAFLVERGDSFHSVLGNLIHIGSLVTDVKALQEIVYRYHLMGETDKGYDHANLLRRESEVYPIGEAEIEIQAELQDRYPNVPPRELLHVAVMVKNGIHKIICSPESAYHQVDEVDVQNVLSRLSRRI